MSDLLERENLDWNNYIVEQSSIKYSTVNEIATANNTFWQLNGLLP